MDKRTTAVITSITGLTEEQQNNRMFESAFDFMAMMGMPDNVAQQFAATRQFWNFYQQEVWHYLNLQFVAFWNEHGQELGHLDWFECFHTISRHNRWLNKKSWDNECNMHIILKNIVKQTAHAD